MIGGGFLGQMNESMKKNREMIRSSLGKTKRKPFVNGDYSTSGDKENLTDNKHLNEKERQELITKVIAENKRVMKKRVIAFIISILVLGVIYLGFNFLI